MSGFRFAEGSHKSRLSGARVAVQGSGRVSAISQPVPRGWTAACMPAPPPWPAQGVSALLLLQLLPALPAFMAQMRRRGHWSEGSEAPGLEAGVFSVGFSFLIWKVGTLGDTCWRTNAEVAKTDLSQPKEAVVSGKDGDEEGRGWQCGCLVPEMSPARFPLPSTLLPPASLAAFFGGGGKKSLNHVIANM